MTYCVAMLLDTGLVFLSDSRTNAGVDQISTFRKATVFHKPGERVLVLQSSGNLAITQSGITGLNCTYTARYRAERRALALEGSYACTDGKQGTFASGSLELNELSMDLRLAIRLSAGEVCAIDSILSMARFPG